MWQRFGLAFSSYSATTFIDLESQEPSQVMKCLYWSCSITSPLPPARDHGATRHVARTLRMGKGSLAEPGQEGSGDILQQTIESWGILKYVTNYKKLRIDTMKVKGGSIGMWEGKRMGSSRSFRVWYGEHPLGCSFLEQCRCRSILRNCRSLPYLFIF